MVNSMVARATSDMLIGPDWAMNIEICDICNHDPVQAKEVVKGIKKRLGSKNPKVQLLVLTLLETIVKNCGDFVHMHVAERNLLQDMVKIVKKKPDFHVKEKILILIDTWQEAFGGARARYPQYYAAYHELLRLGANFPQKSDSAPVFTPPQTQPLSSYQHNLGNPETENEAATRPRSADADVSTLSLPEMQNARGIMDVLAEMLAAVDPEKKEGLKQEVIVDLVEQCRAYKRRVVHLVNSTSDESLLSLGLALNDDLQRVLTKHEALLTGTHVPSEKSKSKPESSQALVPVDTPLIDTKQSGSASHSAAELDLISLAPITTNGQSTTPEKVIVKFDLLSGDDFDSPIASNSLAIVPVGPPQPSTPVSQNNALALVNTFSPQTQQPQNGAFYPNGNVANTVPPQHVSWPPYDQGSNPAWNNHISQQQQQQSHLPGFGAATSGGLPPPPWEDQPANNQLPPMNNHMPPMNNHMPPMNNNLPPMNNNLPPMNNQMPPMNNQMPPMNNQMPPMNNQMPPMNNQPLYNNQIPQFQQQQMAYMHSQQMAQQMAQQMYNNQIAQASGYGGGYGNGYGYGNKFGYGYGQQQNTQYIDQRMSGMPTSTVYTGPSMANTSYIHVPSGKPQKAEDRLFGDLIDFSKVKPNKTS